MLRFSACCVLVLILISLTFLNVLDLISWAFFFKLLSLFLKILFLLFLKTYLFICFWFFKAGFSV